MSDARTPLLGFYCFTPSEEIAAHLPPHPKRILNRRERVRAVARAILDLLNGMAVADVIDVLKRVCRTVAQGRDQT
jgi:hypothetical protein